MKASERIRERLKLAGEKFYANHNISKHIADGELYELENEVTAAFEQALQSLVIDTDNDPNSHETARRMAKMYLYEIMEGRYSPTPKVTAFPNDKEHREHPYDQMLVVRAELRSICSHHHQPVNGVAYIGIIPGETVLGLSKYIRIAQHCARRGTLQEELCEDIAAQIEELTKAKGVGVYIAARHGCCENRGVNAANSLTQTTVLKGGFKSYEVKSEFLKNVQLQEMTNLRF